MPKEEIEVREVVIDADDLYEQNFDLQELEDAIAEIISDKTGFCHKGFDYEIKVTAKLDVSD